jgi:3-hydroxyisobutyrate dehydrogenase-like beta-hydroxyacid dehydrogenase
MQFGAHLEKRGIDFLDAPVTGGTPGAINGELVIYVGGKESVFNKVKPVLGAMGKSLHYIGPTGSGQAVKLINNHLIAAGIMALSEGMILADTMKLSRPKALKALESAPIISQQMIRVMPNYISGEFPVKFTIANLKKDLSLALSEMDDKKKILKLLGVTESLYKKAVKDGKASEDYSAVIKSIK